MRRLWTPRWVLVHAAAVMLMVGFLGLGWWQVRRAAEGNTLSFGYAIEWPVFAAFVAYVWIREVRRALRAPSEDAGANGATGTTGTNGTAGGADQPPRLSPRPESRRNEAAYDDSDDNDLAAYNRYLAWLNAHPHASRSEYPG